ncbi:MAG: DUF4364 family protein [Clostridiales bacterium]|nr:DUF4364 family protein [Clostridiales bacterium]
MALHGFIRTKEELKYLILYVMSFFSEPVNLNDLTDAVMIEEAFGYFEFIDALEELTMSCHIEFIYAEDEKLYDLTHKGTAAAATFSDMLPMVVRDAAKVSALRVIAKVFRDSSIHTEIYSKESGGYGVRMFMTDGDDPLFTLDIAVLDERQGRLAAASFRKKAEKIYNAVISDLLH